MFYLCSHMVVALYWSHIIYLLAFDKQKEDKKKNVSTISLCLKYFQKIVICSSFFSCTEDENSQNVRCINFFCKIRLFIPQSVNVRPNRFNHFKTIKITIYKRWDSMETFKTLPFVRIIFIFLHFKFEKKNQLKPLL